MRVCLFGGTFDPPHNGHLAIAAQCLSELNIDQVLFIPAFLAPHKKNQKISSASDRLAMLHLAVGSNPQIKISEIEINRKGVSYSIDTILQIKSELRIERDDLYFLIGSDSLQEFHTWREPDNILKESQVIVASRPNYSINEVPEQYRERVILLSNPLMNISSTDIRQKIRLHQPASDMVPSAVFEYIEEHNLYQKS